MSISISSQVLGTLSVTIAETTGTLSVSVLSTAPAVLTMELGTPGPAATVTVGTVTALAPDATPTVVNSGTNLAAVLDFGFPSGSTTQVRAQVRNETGATLAKGTVVYINGGAGNKVTVTKAIATGDETSAQTFGVIITDIPNNQNGYACVLGLVENLNTSAYTEGQQLYLSPTTAGAFTTTKPSAPYHMVYVAIVERVHANQGTMLVRIQNGYELEELHNVAIASVANGDLLVYESATSLWKNKSAATAGLLTDAPSDGTTYGRKNGAWFAVGGGGGGASWGSITGTLSNQTDLQNALDAKYDATNPSGYLDQTNADGLYYSISNPANYIDSSAISDMATMTWVNMQGFLTSAPNPSADFMMANAIASLIYSQSTNASGDLSIGNVPQFITGLGTNWGIVDASSTYYYCTGFTSSTYSLSGTAGSGPYYVQVNGTNSAFSF